jgi:hypothetical protein
MYKFKNVIILILVAILGSNIFVVGYVAYKIKYINLTLNSIINKEITDAQSRDNELKLSFNNLSNKIDDTRDDIMSSLLAEKTEEIIKDCTTDQQKCIKIAEWISSNISNGTQESGKDYLAWFSQRNGLCTARVKLFIEMTSIVNIESKMFNIYNFGHVGGGHSCVQAYYDNGWHYFDVTYAGYFVDNNKVMSWDEIVNSAKAINKHMVIFENTLDKYSTEEKASNYDRMKIVYTPESILNAKTYGFIGNDSIKILYSIIDCNGLGEIILGSIDGDTGDVNADGVQKNISEQLGSSIGNAVDGFHVSWNFINCEPGKKYTLTYYLYKASKYDLEFWAKSEGANIVSGNTYSSINVKDKSLDKWAIEFIPDKETCSVAIGYDFKEPGLLYVDKIEIR